MAEPALNAPFFEDVDGFLRWAAGREEAFEFVEGRIVAMSNPSDRHDAVGANFVIALGQRLKGTPCRVYGPGPVVMPGRTRRNARRPDARVVCRRADGAEEVTTVVEVLSPGTEAEDRGVKKREHQAVPSVRHYVLLSRDEALIEVYTRTGEPGVWLETRAEGEGGALRLAALGVSLPLAELYADLPTDGDDGAAENEGAG